MLIRGFREEEIKEAIWECGNSKSLRLDGLNFKFIKECWDILKDDVINFLQDFHFSGTFSRGTNASFITLIPKIDDPQGGGVWGHFPKSCRKRESILIASNKTE